MSDEKMRAEFEVAAKTAQGLDVTRLPHGGYRSFATHQAWWAWQASRANDRQGEAVGRVKTVGGYPDGSEHVVEWLCKHKDLKDGDYLYLTPQPAEQQPEVLASGYFHPLPDENDYEFHAEENFPDGNDCPDCEPAVIVRKSAVAIQPSPDVDSLVEALERLVVDVERGIHVEFGGTPWLKEKIAEIDYARAALSAYRKQQEGQA